MAVRWRAGASASWQRGASVRRLSLTSSRRASPQILGRGRSDYARHAVEAAFAEAGLSATPLREWCVAWPADAALRRDVAGSALYVTLEPSDRRQG